MKYIGFLGIIVLFTACATENQTTPPGQTVEELSPEAIRVSGDGFVPRELVIPKGTEVIWTNVDTEDHTVTFTRISYDEELPVGASAHREFTEIGEFSYVSRTTGNRGLIIVT